MSMASFLLNVFQQVSSSRKCISSITNSIKLRGKIIKTSRALCICMEQNRLINGVRRYEYERRSTTLVKWHGSVQDHVRTVRRYLLSSALRPVRCTLILLGNDD